MDKQVPVALGEKDKKHASLGQRVRNHFYNNRGRYMFGAGAALGAGLFFQPPVPPGELRYTFSTWRPTRSELEIG